MTAKCSGTLNWILGQKKSLNEKSGEIQISYVLWLVVLYQGQFFSLGDSVGKNMPANAGDAGLIPGSGRSPGEANGNPLQYSCLENPMDRGAWQGYSPRGCKELDTAEHALRTENSCLYACKFVLLVALQYIFLITPK